MSDETAYAPPEKWSWSRENGGQFAGINRPDSGARTQQELPVGKHDLQLYSLATPNGVKVNILLEELLEAGHTGAEYDAWPIEIGDGDQFGSGFVAINPNSKIPALVDRCAEEPLNIFESGSILLYLAEKFAAFLPTDIVGRTECLNWLFWQVGSGPFVGGGFGHFYKYAPEKFEYAIDRYTMETKRQLDLLDKHLAEREFIAANGYTIADMAIWPWYGGLVLGRQYDAAEFLDVASYTHLLRWAEALDARPAVKRARRVNKTSGPREEQLAERHSPADFA